ncbi:hypothetical protein ONE63_007942 [Megalurothrips usitatus]|uniref:PLAT domain-containing protein n=1 Tax=Megalurothrips usitatus TaxID=439358 RepID=A0AAV7XPA0_9NEOP|nr:hypothetical protein ONE63_007942 [Megalurothrips usitatus]
MRARWPATSLYKFFQRPPSGGATIQPDPHSDRRPSGDQVPEGQRHGAVAEGGETPTQADLVRTSVLCIKHMGDKPHRALWWQYAQILSTLAGIGVREAGALLDDLTEQMGALAVRVSDQLLQMARQKGPPVVGTAAVLDQFREITRVVTHFTVDPESDTARKIRNLSASGVSEDDAEPDYLLYTDLLPDHSDRGRKSRSLPGLPPVTEDVDSSGAAPALGRITVWSQVDSMAAIAERKSSELPEHCDFAVDREKARAMDEQSEAFAVAVAFIRGSLSWFEPVPPLLLSNTPTLAVVDVQLFEDGPAGPAAAPPQALSVTLPAPAALSGASIRGVLTAPTAGAALWTDHAVVHNLHAFEGTGVLQVTFPATEAGANAGLDMVVVLVDKWPTPESFLNTSAVVVPQRRSEDLSIAIPVRKRLNAFLYMGVAFTNASLQAARAKGLALVSLEYNFVPLSLTCKSWSDSRYKWITDQHQEVWQASGPRRLTCALHHLSLFSGRVVLPPHYVHPLRDAKLFATLHRNWLVFGFIMANLALWLVWLWFARRQDRSDEGQWRVVVLDDIPPEANYPYLLSVFSGNLAQGQTSAYVGIRIFGDKQDSGAHMLSHQTRPLSPLYDDWFLLYTPGPLGDLLSIELWSDCAGMRPYWYCEKVLVEELETGRKWLFPAFCWLSLEHGTRRACVTLHPGELTWQHRFDSLMKASARGDHTWTSVLFSDRVHAPAGDVQPRPHGGAGVQPHHPPRWPHRQLDLPQSAMAVAIAASAVASPLSMSRVQSGDLSEDQETLIPDRNAPPPPAAAAGQDEEAVRAQLLLERLGLDRQDPESCSGYRRLRIRTVPRPSGMPTLAVYVGGWQHQEPPHSDGDDGSGLDKVVEDSLLVPPTQPGSAGAGGGLAAIAPPPAGVSGERAVEGVGAVQAQGAVQDGRSLPEVVDGTEERRESLASAGGDVAAHVMKQEAMQRKRNKAKGRKKAKRNAKRTKVQPGQAKSAWNFRQQLSWRILAGWIICPVTIATCCYFTILYSLKYGWGDSAQWLMSALISIVFSIFVVQPAKIAIVAFVYAFWLQAFAGHFHEQCVKLVASCRETLH